VGKLLTLTCMAAGVLFLIGLRFSLEQDLQLFVMNTNIIMHTKVTLFMRTTRNEINTRKCALRSAAAAVLVDSD